MASGNGASCMELALEGERMCKNGDCRTGVSYFEAAIQVGTEDLKTLSAVYSQLGNAYFYLQEYEKALEFHRHDLTLARTLGDRLGEAKASGNLGNTLKVLGKFEEAIVCCTRHLDISRELSDKIGEARALYNLGNVYHAKGKHLGRSRYREPGDFPEEVRQSLERAVEFYEANLALVKELNDKAAEGRAYGNLGNTHYLLGNFDKAVQYHEERLLIARSFNDTSAERRAFSNLGNAHVFLGEFEIAAEYYKKTLEIAKALNDRAIEAQACYSIGNTYTLLKLFDKAADYHQKHLEIAKELSDRVGEGRAYWSLGNAYTALGKHTLALEFAEKHLLISKEVGDRTGELTAEMNISDLKLVLGINDDHKRRAGGLSPNEVKEVFLRENRVADITTNGTEHTNELRVRTDEQRALSAGDVRLRVGSALPRVSSLDEGPGDDFFDLIMKAQGGRMNDQRCELPPVNKNHSQPHAPNPSQTPVPPQASGSGELQVPRELGNSTSTEDLFEMVMKMQGDRMEEQRYEMPVLPGLDPKVLRREGPNPNDQLVKKKLMGEQSGKKTGVPDDAFLDMLMRCQATRIDDQRCDFPTVPRGPTVPDEDFFNLIIKLQSKRIESQRANFNGP